ncbi:pimeloyl-ACP methyl ester carboxylesterase [Rhizobium sp. BK529]|uniref:alpha/beta fold hydrolase n=1 Tax=unclassified Rhizobium TaxID=2613769 RepID=UPI00104DF59E|nr:MULTISPECIES: alpha/beta hydrolase [unclassified Rhizobium]MBB3594996.1 pimeloyl-ACP methyl ester carboxylesterase [Rhizobium sp. BK529]TCR98744.1 pimeloyl-ACP methyl ester carboxylesterase [Rhizobium sp. BK418]
MFSSRYNDGIETSHGRLAIRLDGPQGGIPLLLLQRFRGTMDDWDPAFIAAIAKDRRIIRFDSAGVGRSNGTVPATIGGMAAIAADVVAVLGLSQVDVLGWSLGGAVGLEFALNFPHLVRRLIVAGSSPGPVAEGPQQHPRVPHVMTKSENDEDDFLFLFYPSSECATAAGRSSLARIRLQPDCGPATSPLALMMQVKAISSWPGILHRASELRLPILVTNGAHDVMIPAFRSYVLSQQAPDAKLILYPDSGHAFLFQEIESFSRDVEQFLEG